MAKKKDKNKSSSSGGLQYIAYPMPTSMPTYTPGTYTSKYQGQIDTALNDVLNYKYDPLKDANYQALAKIYGARGDIAARNTLGEAAALNGGYGTSYGASAAQQARNQYNQELAALVPDLEQNAFNKTQARYSALMNADNTDYSRFRDSEGDRQFQFNAGMDQYNAQMNAFQAALDYNMNLMAQKRASKKSSAGGSGGSSRKSGGGGGYTSGGYTGSVMPYTQEDINNAKYTKSSSSGKKQGPTQYKGFTLDELLDYQNASGGLAKGKALLAAANLGTNKKKKG